MTLLTLDQHLAGIEAAADRLATWSADAGPDAPVPPCPSWTVRDLLVHQGAIHRWATAILGGADPRQVGGAATESEGRSQGDPVDWLAAGVTDLLDALRTAPDDLDVFTFLEEAPPARLFWARRQHHETTVHALDALAARESRMPTAEDAWTTPEAALDGIDELVVGFWQRRTKGPRAGGDPYSVVLASDTGHRWLLDVGRDSVTTRRLDEGSGSPTGAAVVAGAPVDLFLGLWNRGGIVADPQGLLPRWRAEGAVIE